MVAQAYGDSGSAERAVGFACWCPETWCRKACSAQRAEATANESGEARVWAVIVVLR
jgi:hypothetical protein